MSAAFQYTPGQLRRAVSIPPETYRHWKKLLAPLRRHRGHSPCFTSGDLVAVAVVRTLCVDLGIRVGTLSDIAGLLFEVCNQAPWPVLERGKLIFDLPNGEVHFQPELTQTSSQETYIVAPLRLIVGGLRDQLLAASEPDDQLMLRFPPTALKSELAPSGLRGRS